MRTTGEGGERAMTRRRVLALVAVALLGAPLAWAPGAAASGNRPGHAKDDGGMVPQYIPDRWPGDQASAVLLYPDGRYELRGDGVSVPYHWVWVPAGAPPPVRVPATPPPLSR